MKVFSKYLRKAALGFAVAATMLLAACSGVDSGDDVPVITGGPVTLRVAVDSIGRTALPQFEKEDFTSFKLTWESGATKGLKQWIPEADEKLTAYQMMNNDSFTLPAGTYTFVLTGTDANGTIYKGTLPDKTVTQDSMLSFVLELSKLSSDGDGYLDMKITYPCDNVKKLHIEYYKIEDYKSMDENSRVEAPNGTWVEENVSGTGTASYATSTGSGVAAGAYIFEITFYDENGVLMGEWLEYVYIAAGKTSKTEIAIDSLDDVYTITYKDADDADFGDYMPLYFTGRDDVELPEPRKTGCTFEGWFTGVLDEATGKVTLSDKKIEGWNAGEQTENITLYAKWKVDTYKVKFYDVIYSDDIDEASPYDVQTITRGEKASVPATAPTRTGYTFEKWVVSDPGRDFVEFDFDNTTITEETYVYAYWSYEVAFDANAGDDTVTGTMTAQKMYTSWLWFDGTILPANAFKRTGYTFLGWATKKDASEAAYADGGDLFDNNVDDFDRITKLYAVWHNDASGYVVTFDAAGGTTVAAQALGEDQTVDSYLTNTYKRDFTLVGWFTGTVDAETGEVTLSDTPYDFDTIVTESFTLYAKWERTSFYVSADGSDDTGDGTKEKPFASISKAVSLVKDAGNSEYDYIIKVCGELKGGMLVYLDERNLPADKAKSLIIMGNTDNETDILNGSESGCVAYITTKVPVTFEDIKITNGNVTTQVSAGGIYMGSEYAQVTLEYGTLVTGNKTSNALSAGGVYVTGTLIIESGAEISENTGYNGAGIYMSANAKVIMNGGMICDNTVTGSGAGVYAYAGSSFTMDGGEISGNTASSGGGVYLNTATFTMSDGTIRDNTASYGGGLYFDSATATMTDGEITGNFAKDEGGGVYQYNSTFTMSDGTIADNMAERDGGGIFLYFGKFTMCGGIIADNTAGFRGGGVFEGYWNTVYLSGSAYIPAGDDGENDVYLEYPDSYYPVVAGELTADAPVATITPNSYTDGSRVLRAEGIPMTQDVLDMFAVTPLDGATVTLRKDGYDARLVLPSYTITYMDKGGEKFSGKWTATPAKTYALGSTNALPVPTKDGALFVGWFMDADCFGEAVTTFEGLSGDLTLYAYWSVPTVDVTVESGDISVKKAQEGDTITLTAADGYTAYTWTVEGKDAKQFITGSSVSEDGKVFTFSKTALPVGEMFMVRLTAKNKNGVPYSTNIIIQK